MSGGKLVSVVISLVVLVGGGVYAQQTSTTAETKQADIIYVSGNRVVFVMDGQVMEREVPADFRVMLDGRPVPVSELLPGQKVVIERTTTTTVVPATRVVEVRNGEVVNVTARTLTYREDGETKSVVVPSDFRFMVGGKAVGLEGLRKGDKLTATVVTETAETSTTTREVRASGTTPERPAPPLAPVPVAAPAPAPAAPAKVLPTTASPFPLLGLVGGLLLAVGAGLSSVRRSLLL